jgi:hypothetical protein
MIRQASSKFGRFLPRRRHDLLAAVYNKSPVGNSFTAGLDPATAAFLQQVAADTVKEYLGL